MLFFVDMSNFYKKFFNHRFGPVAIVAMFVIVFGFLTRLILFIKSWPNLQLNFVNLPGIFLFGLFYDLVVASFFSIPIALYCWLMRDRWYRKIWGIIPIYFMLSAVLFLLLINIGAEIAFWDEFGVRYNFIAVDYLVYTNEVLGNIQQSYNIPLIVGSVLLIMFVILWQIRRVVLISGEDIVKFRKRTNLFFLFLLFPLSAYFLVNNRFKNFSSNNYVNELAGAGIYEFGAAFWHNEIDYNQFYKVNSDQKNISILRRLLNVPGIEFSKDSLGIERNIVADSPVKKWNVVLISIESFSADFMQYFGNNQHITPHLDSLIPHSLFFNNFYASGTRTVRGLEALSLSIPPTPGQSIVRRPNNESMFTIGSVFKKKGYDVNYIYGGNSFFDNMGYFFENNGYNVIDKKDIPASKIHHETAWGVADEDAFNVAMETCDNAYQSGKLFFNHIMTVSNHRPFTYPDGRIDIPSSSKCREGAVKYTDYAINKFLNDAKSKPWFNNTLFVIVADHCASSAGKTDLPVSRYHIPCFVYAPSLIKPAIVSKLTSQIDLAPTVLGLLNMQYQSRFMGYDIFKTSENNERIFISTYQDLGYLKKDTLVILYPKNKIRMFLVNKDTGDAKEISLNIDLVNEAIAWYQGACLLFKSGRYKFDSK